nr:XrtA/PEP-CTERM system TPR-repeat protein PrsT [Desulfocurvibacter africanus]
MAVTISVILGTASMSCQGKTKEDAIMESRQYYADANYNGAVVLLKNYLEENPEDIEARSLLIQTYKKLGKWVQVRNEANTLLSREPNNPDHLLVLAEAMLRTNDVNGALETARAARAAAKDKDSTVSALALVAEAAMAVNDPGQAEAVFRELQSIDPDSAAAHLGLAHIFLQRDDNGGARTEVDAILAASPDNEGGLLLKAELHRREGDREGMLKAYHRLAEMAPGNARMQYRLGLLLLDMGKTGEAKEHTEALSKSHPEYPESDLLLGIIAYGEGNYKESQTALERSLSKEARIDTFFHLARTAIKLGYLEIAVSHLNRVLDHDPDFMPARLLLTETLLRQQRFDAALAMAERISQDEPGSAQARMALGAVLVASGRENDGLAMYDQASTMGTGYAEAYVRKGVIHANHGRTEAALESLQAALKVDPANMSARTLLYGYHLRKKEYDKAEAILRPALNGSSSDALIFTYLGNVEVLRRNFDSALFNLDKALNATPCFPQAHMSKAKIYLLRRDREHAKAEYRMLLAQDPRHAEAAIALSSLLRLEGKKQEAGLVIKEAGKSQETRDLLLLARHLQTHHDTVAALAMADRALVQDARSLDALALKGDILLEEGKHEQAFGVYDSLQAIDVRLGLHRKISAGIAMGELGKAAELAQRLVEHDPASSDGYLILASLRERQGRYEDALAILKQTVQSHDSATARLALAQLHMRHGETGQARQIFSAIVKSEPDNAQALFGLGLVHESQGEALKAMKAYEQAVEADGGHVPALNNLALLYAKGIGGPEKKTQALALAFMAYQRSPQEPSIADTLGVALLAAGRDKEAVQMLERAERSLPHNPSIKFNLARAYVAVGNVAAAKSRLVVALGQGTFPESVHAQSLLDTLK